MLSVDGLEVGVCDNLSTCSVTTTITRKDKKGECNQVATQCTAGYKVYLLMDVSVESATTTISTSVTTASIIRSYSCLF